MRLTEDGVDWGAKPGPGDEIGYAMSSTDDCFQAAIATCCQVAIEEVPDLRLDERLELGEDPDLVGRTAWETVDRWAAGRGLTMLLWGESLLPVPRDRWIGVVRSANTGARMVVDESGRMVREENVACFNDHRPLPREDVRRDQEPAAVRGAGGHRSGQGASTRPRSP